VKSAEVEAHNGDSSASESQMQLNMGVKVVLGVSVLSIWMLLMTAAYFHTWFEKVSYIYTRPDI
jgi:Inositol phospholipid synthesis and fat-storage-inducing TM